LRQVGFFRDIREPNLREFLDLVALGTIADIVPLVDENRVMVAFGLRELTDSRRAGVQALKDIAGITGEVDCGSVGFRLAPRLNAAGRLEDASFGVELLLTSDVQRAKTLAASLDASNEERQAIEQEILVDAVARVKNDPSLDGRKSIVLASDTWHCGVIGIVASRLVELFHRPTILISLQEEIGKGSGRSIPGFHLRDALLACSEHLVRFGGHKYAAGLTIESNTLEVFTERFDEIASGLLSPEDLLPEIRIDAILSPDRISIDLAEQVSSLEPFGMGNPRPVFAMRGVELSGKSVFKDRHVRLRLGSAGFSFDAVGFSMADRMPDSDLLDVAFSLEINSWNGRKKIRLKLKDVREYGGFTVSRYNSTL
jgi:single-stranded-DNA-specific exonuclease